MYICIYIHNTISNTKARYDYQMIVVALKKIKKMRIPSMKSSKLNISDINLSICRRLPCSRVTSKEVTVSTSNQKKKCTF